MLTIRNIRCSHAKHYYQAESIDEAEWFGKGAANLSLRGMASPESFKKMLDKQLIGPNSTGVKRSGYDLCFGCDKSISLLGLVAQRQDVIDAHKQAVQDSLKKIEDDLIQVRASVHGKRKAFYSHNLIAAQFHHATSRADDPHLHTHVVLFNASKFANKWRAILEKNLYDNVVKLGQLYRNSLEMKLQRLGFNIEKSLDGWIKVQGYTKQQLLAFSQRKAEIDEVTGGNVPLKITREIGLRLRPQKSNIPINELILQWQEKSKNLDIVHPAPDLRRNQIDNFEAIFNH